MLMWKKIVILGSALILASCAHVPEQPIEAGGWHAQEKPVRLAADGRVSVVYQGRGSSASFDWSKTPSVENMEISLPLGITLGQLCVDKQGAVLKLATRSHIEQDKTAGLLSKRLLGTEVPFEYLSTWVNGGWVTEIPHRIEADGTLVQAGWNVRRTVDSNGQPRLLEVQKENAVLKLAFQSFDTEAVDVDDEECAIRSKP